MAPAPSDRRLTPFSGRRALALLRGQVDAEFTEGEAGSVLTPIADLLARPGGARDRQVLLGEPLTVIDRRDGHAFVQMGKDGYCGWLVQDALGPAFSPTHWIAARATHLYPEPRVQAHEIAALPFGARLEVTEDDGKWARIAQGWLPSAHLRRWGDWFHDPVTVAELFAGTPYLWGGNSGAGLDCSGLVQAAFAGCGRFCPGDSDLQAGLGAGVPEGAPLRRGDLIFWKGHVALVAEPDLILHANGHSMDTRFEGLTTASARIAAQGGGPVTARRRV